MCNKPIKRQLSLWTKVFLKVRIDRLTKAEVQFVKAMAASGDGPYPMADIAAAMGRTLSSLGPARASIIKKGMIYSTDHGIRLHRSPFCGVHETTGELT